MTSAPAPRIASTPMVNRAGPSGSPSNVSPSACGTPTRSTRPGCRASGADRLHGSRGSGTAAIVTAQAASLAVAANTDTQSSERHAGTTPRALIRPRVGLTPAMPLQAAGTRAEPAGAGAGGGGTRAAAPGPPAP